MKNRLRQLRRERKLTQLALQMKTGIEQALISKYETGERIPPTETLVILADFFNVSIDYLLCRTDNPKSTVNLAESGGILFSPFHSSPVCGIIDPSFHQSG